MNVRCGWIYLSCFALVSGFAQPNGASHSVTLDLVVTDKSGKPVSGLEQQDFTLLDNKQPRKIVSFQAVQAGAAKPDPPVEVVLLVDEVNSTYSRIAYERDEIEKFLHRNGGELPNPVSLAFLADSGMVMGNPSSQDGNAVLAELKQKASGLRTIGRSQGVYGGEDRLQISLNALNQLISYDLNRPGRKLVVWISPGWPFLSGAGIDAGLTVKQRQPCSTTLLLFRMDCGGLASHFTMSIRWEQMKTQCERQSIGTS
jgi:VWFA-related protein